MTPWSTLPELVRSLRGRGLLTPAQAELLEAVHSDEVFSVHQELRALLYIGALSFAAGVAATVQKYVHELGHAAILGALTASVAACAVYVHRRAPPYSPAKVESPTIAFDYVLYLGCALLGVEFGYLERNFHLLGRWWELYLLASSGACLALAYRYDNRLVLGLALASLGGWLGLTVDRLGLGALDWRWRTMIYGALVCGWGLAAERTRAKPHFTDTYLTLGLNAILMALLIGVFKHKFGSLDLPALALLAGASIRYSLRRDRFEYLLWGTLYGYVGLSAAISDLVSRPPWVYYYYLSTSIAVVAVLFVARRRFKE